MVRASCTWSEVGFYSGSAGKPRHKDSRVCMVHLQTSMDGSYLRSWDSYSEVGGRSTEKLVGWPAC